MKSAIKILGATVAVLSLGYGVSRIPDVRSRYDLEYRIKHQEDSKYDPLRKQLNQ